MKTITTPDELLKTMIVDHPYYHYSEHIDTHNSLKEFLESWKPYDIDQNRIIRWDIRNVTDDWPVEAEMSQEDIEYFGPWGTQYAELHFVAPRKGRTYTQRILNLKPDDTPRLFAFLKKHWEYIQKVWEPLPSIDYVPSVTPQTRFLDSVKGIVDKFAVDGGNKVELTVDDVNNRIEATAHAVLEVLDSDYMLFEKPGEEVKDLLIDPELNISGDLAPTFEALFNDINN